MKNTLTKKLDNLLTGDNHISEIQSISKDIHPAVIASKLSEFDREKIFSVLNILGLEQQAQVFSHFKKHVARDMAALYSDAELADIIELMPHDDRVDLIRVLPMERRESLLRNIEQPDRDDILKLSRFDERTAGAEMTSDYVRVKSNLTVEEALQKVRRVAKDRETIYNVYVVDEQIRLIGIVSLRDLVLFKADQKIEDVMTTEVITARVDEDKEIVANRLSEYDLIAMPVIDSNDRLMGIITFDDVMDVRQEEATTDFHKMGSVGLMNVSLKDASVWFLFLKRAPWLLVLVFMNIFSGAGIAYFEDTIEAVVALVFFLPLLIDSGGNAGSQASTLMVRALAIGEVKIKDWFRLFGKEIFVAITIGVAMGIAVSAIGFFRAGSEVAFVVSLTMICCVLVGSLLGMSLPFLLQKMNFDPATASAPLITSLADIAGVLMYFSIATWYLGIGG